MREEIFRGIPEEKTRHNQLNYKEAAFSLLLSDGKSYSTVEQIALGDSRPLLEIFKQI